MKRTRRSVVSALRASSKQHSAKLSNCLVKVALIARKQRRRIEEVPTTAPVLYASKPEILNNCSHTGSADMDWNRVEGNWKQLKGKVKEKWGNLTDDDLTAINGQRDQLEGKIQERYGLAKDQVRKDVDDWYNAQSW